MPQDTGDIKDIADRLEIRPKPGEREAEFRARVALEYLKQSGDAFEAAEIVLGKAPEELGYMKNRLALLLQVYNIKSRREWYSMVNDTYHGMSFEEYEGILTGNRFEKAFSYGFADTDYPNEQEEFSIWARRDRGLLLTAESCDGRKSVNSTKLFYELSLLIGGVELDELDRISAVNILDGTSNSPCIDRNSNRVVAITVERDARQGLVEYLQELEASGLHANNPWKFPGIDFLGLCDYSETTTKGYDPKAIAQSKIAQLPKDIQVMMGVNPSG